MTGKTRKAKTVVATGAFQIIHPGHILFLKNANELGRLVVIVARDKNIKKNGKAVLIPEKQRREVISALSMVDEAILGDSEDIFKPIAKIDPDFIALGPDQKTDEKQLEKELKKRGLGAKIVRIAEKDKRGLSSTRRIMEKIRKIKNK